MRIILATGGTGGHLFPALKTAVVLKNLGHEIIFCGSFGVAVEKITDYGFEYHNLNAKGLSFSTPIKFIQTAMILLAVSFKSIALLNKIQPAVICGFGGYGAFPVIFAGCFKRIPCMIHEQNVVPGRANKMLDRWVRKVAVSFKAARKYFKNPNIVLTGCPCHHTKVKLSQKECRAKFGLDRDRLTLLIIGGSQGSQRINEVVSQAVMTLENKADIQVIHMTGPKDCDSIKTLYLKLKLPTAVFPFIDCIETAYQAADLVIARSGAATVSELAVFQKLSILIPYPHAGGHQKENAKILADCHEATIIDEKELTADTLRKIILEQLQRIISGGVDGRGLSQITIPEADHQLAKEIIALGS